MFKDRCEIFRNHKAADDAYRAGEGATMETIR